MLKNSEREVRGAASQERIIWFSMLLLALASVAIALFLSNANVVITHNNLKPPKKKTPSNNSLAQAGKHAVAYTAPSLWFIMLIVVIVSLIIFLVCLFLWLRWQKLQRRAAQSQKQEVEEKEEEVEEVHETLFNWSLFLAQLLALLAQIGRASCRERV